jgi:nucleoside-diphosphate-sugar epimerase
MKCLVTGASGSVGCRIVKRLLEEGHSVRGLVRRTSDLRNLETDRIEHCYGDMTDPDSLREAVRGVEWIFHAAAPVDDWVPASVFHQVNVEGSRHLIDACEGTDLKRLVFVSSVNVYGVQPPARTDEETPYHPCGIAYCDTKIRAEKMFLEAHKRTGLPVTILRPANVWGPTAKAWTVRPVEKLLAGKVRLIDHGSGAFNSTYVDNFADACLLAAEKPEAVGEAFIATDGFPDLRMKDFFDSLADLVGVARVEKSVPKPVALGIGWCAETVAKITGGRPFITRFVIEMLTKGCHYDTRKLREVLGFRPRYSIEEGMALTKEWLMEQKVIPPAPPARK